MLMNCLSVGWNGLEIKLLYLNPLQLCYNKKEN
jgi:hypothetical protein